MSREDAEALAMSIARRLSEEFMIYEDTHDPSHASDEDIAIVILEALKERGEIEGGRLS